MNLTKAIRNYKEIGDFFAPDYERENEVLTEFKVESPNISVSQTEELINLLENSEEWQDKFFLADLLYLYDSFDVKLLEPLIENAIRYTDPSFSRIFLRPGIRAFGSEIISEILAQKFIAGNVIRKIRISSLVYWIERADNSVIQKLEKAIVERANKTGNIIELYYYNRYFPDKVGIERQIPNDANELMRVIKGNSELEEL